jgi:hypothetical protein
MKRNILTFKELDSWLSENFYFEDGYVLQIEEDPLNIIVGYDIKASYEAYSEKQILPFMVIPAGVEEWNFDREVIPVGDRNHIESIEPVEVDNGVCIEFATPAVFRLRSKSLVVEQQNVIRTVCRPWVSNSEIFIKVGLSFVPRAEFWKCELERFGHNISFRYYGGDSKELEKVPYPNYEGYYIQLSDRIKSTTKGIFFFHVRIDSGQLYLALRNDDDVLRRVWQDLTLILAAYPNTTIKCGNCRFTGSEWIRYLTDGTLPSPGHHGGNTPE